MEILNKFNKFGIFDYLYILTQLNDKGKEIKDQIKKYSSLVDKILNENKNDINYSSINKKNNLPPSKAGNGNKLKIPMFALKIAVKFAISAIL